MTMRKLVIAGCLMLAACAKSNDQGSMQEANAENVEASATDMNAADSTMVDVNVTDMNADMNAVEMNAAMNVDMNASDMNAVAVDVNAASMNVIAHTNAETTPAENATAAFELNNVAASNPPATAAATGPRVDCDILGQRVTPDDCEDARALARDVKPGAAALDVPDPMTRGRKAQVTLVIDRRPIETIKKIETSGAPSDEGVAATPNQVTKELPGKDYSFPSGIGRFMTASLAGEGFGIKLLSPANPLQEIPPNGRGTWIWEVTPEEAGPHILTAQTEAVAIIGNKTVPLGNGATTKTVKVKVRKMDWLHDFLAAVPDWLKLITAILLAAGALVGAWFGLRKAMRG
jgi:hypothetical protein